MKKPFSFEIIIVNNNSRDNTREIALEFAATRPYLHIIDEMTQGKGAAVRTGMLAAKGEYLFMADADFSTWVQPAELATVMLFLASDAASAVTGALLPVKGRV